MTAKKPPAARKFYQNNLLKVFVVFFTLILPTVLLIAGIYIFYKTNRVKELVEEGEVGVIEGALKPSQLLADRNKYKDQKLVLAGRVDQSPVTCERKDCPELDPCCGCPEERDLVMADAEKPLLKEPIWKLRLLDQDGRAFCQRKSGSCDYECPGWQIGDIYEVGGTFFAEPPPAGTGWRLYSDFYFQVESQSLVKKVSLLDLPGRLVRSAQELIKGLKTTGYYVLP